MEDVMSEPGEQYKMNYQYDDADIEPTRARSFDRGHRTLFEADFVPTGSPASRSAPSMGR
jgi:hypothetical protein